MMAMGVFVSRISNVSMSQCADFRLSGVYEMQNRNDARTEKGRNDLQLLNGKSWGMRCRNNKTQSKASHARINVCEIEPFSFGGPKLSRTARCI
jgi:hypothetical protein